MQYKIDNPEKQATYGTQNEEKQNKNNTIHVDKARTFQQTTEGKDEPNICLMRKSCAFQLETHVSIKKCFGFV